MMKKYLLIIIFLSLCTYLSGQRKGVNISLMGLIPTGDIGDSHGFGLGTKLQYLFGEENFHFGATGGLVYFFKSQYYNGPYEYRFLRDNLAYVPLGGSLIAKAGPLIFTLDGGYAVGVSESVNGGVYYYPSVGFNSGLGFSATFGYFHVQEGDASVSSFTPAFNFKLYL